MHTTATHDAPPFHYSPEALAEVKGIVQKFPEGKHKSALLRALHIAQEENNGWLSVPAMDHVAEVLGIRPIEVYEVTNY